MRDITRALELWVEITGVDPRSGTFRIRDYDIHDMNRELKESVAYDNTNLTTAALMRYFLDEFLENRSFTAKSIMDDYDSIVGFLSKCKELKGLIYDEDITEILDDFKAEIKAALDHYGVVNELIYKTAGNDVELAFLRRDALRSIETLTVHQFSQGTPEKEKPIFYQSVHQCWNIDTLIQAACRMKSGISLNLIRDDKSDASYFAFAIRNGGTVTILTDKPKFHHPMQKNMSRTRGSGRSFMERIARHHLPYSLMDISYGDNYRAYVKEDQKNLAVLKNNDKMTAMKEIKDLEPDEVIWTIMIFSLIEEKFFKNQYRTPELSYTASMIRQTQTMLAHAEEHQLAIVDYRILEVPVLTTDDVTTEKMLDEWERTPTRQNEWIEKRYGHKVPNSLLTFHEDDGKRIYLIPDHLENDREFTRKILPRIKEETTPMLPGEANEAADLGYKIVRLTDEQYNHALDWSFDQRDFENATFQLRPMDSTTIGTAKELVSDFRWTARYNKVKLMQFELDREFRERKNEILSWYQETVQKNLSKLYKAIAEGKLHTSSEMEHGFASPPQDKGGNILRLIESGYYDSGTWSAFDYYSWKDGSKLGCMVNRNTSTMFAYFQPKTTKALALLCGCEIEELPDILQHWTTIEHYRGNSILDRLDPLEWAIQNPWAKLNFNVCVYLSKTGYAEICKEHGFPVNRFWIPPKKEPDPNERKRAVKPKEGDKVEFGTWHVLGHQRTPPQPWIGEVVNVVKEGRVNGVYHIKRDYDGHVFIQHGYQGLLIPQPDLIPALPQAKKELSGESE